MDSKKLQSSSHATYGLSYTEYQVQRSRWRQAVRRLYLNAAVKLTKGPALDFGCGAGELLKLLPEGSVGVEYNQNTVTYCQQQGLNVHWYDGFKDGFSLTDIPWRHGARTLYLSHLLEHFDDPMKIMGDLIESTQPDIERVVIILPGKSGFKIDPTHRTFVDLGMIKEALNQLPEWSLTYRRYFPINHERAGDYLAHNELQLIVDRTGFA
ncbi:methyltransferase domain-containing protein [Hydrogenophaga sp. PAMC20947]|uniref:class I SAM-dependent methyltransferase n=1 Tax=Hydrogenophaga sp. PAMC20947 TaxID=2565558 RepID=UPI001445D286|nr:methyltransferase domain-containing protein [Hydrogenophaga sp. PAMC20947]